MRQIFLFPLLLTLLFCSTRVQADEVFPTAAEVINMNNQGVLLLNNSKYAESIQVFEEAIKLDPYYQMARYNYSIALNNYGLALQDTPEKALQMFERALFFDFENITTQHNADGIIKMMGLEPKDPAVRIDLGNKALVRGDLKGAMAEFHAAMMLCSPKKHKTEREPKEIDSDSPDENVNVKEEVITKKEVQTDLAPCSPTERKVQELQAMLMEHPENSWTRITVARHLLKNKEKEQAVYLLEEGVNLFPNDKRLTDALRLIHPISLSKHVRR